MSNNNSSERDSHIVPSFASPPSLILTRCQHCSLDICVTPTTSFHCGRNAVTLRRNIVKLIHNAIAGRCFRNRNTATALHDAFHNLEHCSWPVTSSAKAPRHVPSLQRATPAMIPTLDAYGWACMLGNIFRPIEDDLLPHGLRVPPKQE
ncbi:uncharacterized protein G2W53_018300 [Senna tora]|uniref:Uncharacterized protein n=1 Tax=Senna tora TaxID=362788 RepID=A0A834WPQ4_9FABA|nr:uncharacterized protein G2W53_018300 [Senna tora]